MNTKNGPGKKPAAKGAAGSPASPGGSRKALEEAAAKAKADREAKTDEAVPAAGDEIGVEQATAADEAQEAADKAQAKAAKAEAKERPGVADPEIYDAEGRERRDMDGNLKKIEPTQERLEAEHAERQASLEAGTG